jgi:hypothetical protein
VTGQAQFVSSIASIGPLKKVVGFQCSNEIRTTFQAIVKLGQLLVAGDGPRLIRSASNNPNEEELVTGQSILLWQWLSFQGLG